ncbi:MAG: 1-acyl-sn-glycerol-3-phosphate acyltransferase [Clostridia bacterium]|nr:1-acyl-sn-glycerol-3-phosphate acyltransferase [Clostridia bacterium]
MNTKEIIGFTTVTTLLKPIFRGWYTPKIFGKENIPKKGAVVIACNHKHIMDQCMVICATRRPISYMAKSEYFKGHFAWFFRLTGCICVNRNGNDIQAKQEANSHLANGGALGIFPEGTRNRTENLLTDFRYGAASLACKNNALLLPVAVTGDYNFRSKTLAARIGKPFSTENMTTEQANERLKAEITRLLLENLQAGYGTVDEYLKAEMLNNP